MTAPEAPSPSVLIVAGFHRSGTSLAASVLHRAGLHLGEDLIGAMPSNPLGHFEDREIVSFHNDLLDDNGTSWQATTPLLPVVTEYRWNQMRALIEQRHGMQRPWGFKDPRTSLFLPLWKHALPDARVLIMYRPWWECVASLRRRHADGLERRVGDQTAHQRFVDEPDLGHRLWLAYNEALIRFATSHPEDVAVVAFGGFRAGFPLIEALEARWHVGLRPIPVGDVFEPGAVTSNAALPDLPDTELASRLATVLGRLDGLALVGRPEAATP